MTLWLANLLVLFLLGQDSAPPAEDLQAGEQTVDVDQPTPDLPIRDRLRSILGTTPRFEGVEVDTDNGVVFLRGFVQDEADRRWVADLASKTEGVVAVLNRLEVERGPLWDFGPAVQELRALWRQFIAALPQLAAGLLFLLLTLLVAGFVARAISRPLTRRVESELLRTVMEKLAVVAVMLAGVYVFLRISGLTQVAVTVVGGTGVVGLILGFAFRDIAENFLASILISIQRPFRYGDKIDVEGSVGIVQRVTPRGTILMDFEGNYIQIANARVYKSTIKNFTANPKVRQDFVIGIGYDAGIAKAQEISLGVLEGHSAVLADPRPNVLVDELASSTVNLRIYFWIDGGQHSEQKVRSALMRMVLRALEAADISMPDDSREILFPDGVPVRMLDVPAADPAPVERGSSATVRADTADTADTAESTEAEGGLVSDTEEINDQARESRQPEEGADVLAP